MTIRKWITNPWFSVAFGAICAVLGIYFTLISVGAKEPMYAIGNSYPYVVAYKNLSIFWEGKPIKTAYLVDIALWNGGNQPIDAGDIPAGTPILIRPRTPVHILDSRPMYQRPTLGLEATPQDIMGANVVHINWKNDEALDPQEGGVIRIRYEASKPTTFYVAGRIKGVPGGFKELHFTFGLDRLAAWFYLIIAIVLLIFAFHLIWIFSRSARKTWARFRSFDTPNAYIQAQRKNVLIGTGILLLTAAVFGYLAYEPLAKVPSWVSTVHYNSKEFLKVP